MLRNVHVLACTPFYSTARSIVVGINLLRNTVMHQQRCIWYKHEFKQMFWRKCFQDICCAWRIHTMVVVVYARAPQGTPHEFKTKNHLTCRSDVLLDFTHSLIECLFIQVLGEVVWIGSLWRMAPCLTAERLRMRRNITLLAGSHTSGSLLSSFVTLLIEYTLFLERLFVISSPLCSGPPGSGSVGERGHRPSGRAVTPPCSLSAVSS